METMLDKGYRLTGPVVNLAAAGVANATAIYTPSTFNAAILGTKSFKLKKLVVRNNAAGALWLFLGIGVAGTFVAHIPAVRILNNLDSEWMEVELPSEEFFVPFTAYPDALVAGGSVDCYVEVEEIG